MYVHDILAEDGTIIPELYGRIQNKHFYIQTLSMVQVAFKAYKTARYLDDMLEKEEDPAFDVTNKVRMVLRKICISKGS